MTSKQALVVRVRNKAEWKKVVGFLLKQGYKWRGEPLKNNKYLLSAYKGYTDKSSICLNYFGGNEITYSNLTNFVRENIEVYDLKILLTPNNRISKEKFKALLTLQKL